MPGSLAAAAAAAAAAATAAAANGYGYPPQSVQWNPAYVAHQSGSGTALEADLGKEGDPFTVPGRRAHSQQSFTDQMEDIEAPSEDLVPPPFRRSSDEERGGAVFRVVSAGPTMSSRGSTEPPMQCRPNGSTPVSPYASRPPAPLSPQVDGIEAESEGETNAADEGEMVLYTEVASDPSGPPGLGSIQPNGRAQVLQEWCAGPGRPSALQECTPPTQSAPSAPGRFSQNLPRPLDAVRALLHPAQSTATTCTEGNEVEWSSLSDSAKHALKQWCAGNLGGRHCMLIVEHNSGSDAAMGCDEPCLTNLRGGAALNVLSGLQAEVELFSQSEGCWLFTECFAKPPTKVLEEAISAAVREVGDPNLISTDLSVEQVNLALRRRAMNAQCVSPFAPPSAEGGPKSSDEYVRTQVWLELLRQCTEGPREGTAAVKDKEKPSKGEKPPAPWNDLGVLKDLGKSQLNLEVESEKMGLDAIRVQNRHIEEYVMRLVRQRDELKNMMKLVEERDSYFILGLDGPEASEEEVKKAYRALARKEHPDKAGIGNKRRFQAIQQAYSNILRQKGEGALLGMATEGGSESSSDKKLLAGPLVTKAAEFSRQAKEAANGVAACAHQALKMNEDCNEAQSGFKKKPLRYFRELTKKSVAELRNAAAHLRSLGTSVCKIAECAEAAMNDKKDAADKTVAGVGIRDRAVIVEDAGRSSLSSADLLEKIGEATEATLRKVEKADAPQEGVARAARDDAANLLRLGVRLLSESLARTATVARRSADEAIGAAIKGHELCRGLAAVDLETRKEREKAAAKQRSFDGDDEVIAASDAPREDQEPGSAPEKGDDPDEPKGTGTPRNNDAVPGQSSPRDQLKSAAKRVKERHVALRVKNLTFLTSLNEEALKLKARLRTLLERSEGALLPEVSILQKKQVFDLVAQLLQFAVSELGRLIALPNVAATSPLKVLERVLSFAISLEHARDVAMPAESRTQALKLAALLDSDLLCQIVGGPFRARLIATISRKGPGAGRPEVKGSRLNVRNTASAEMSLKAWNDAANLCCERIVTSIRALNATASAEGDAA